MHIFIAILILLGVALGILIIRNRKDTYVSEIIVNKPYDVVWGWVSDPLKYPTIYPNWLKTVSGMGGDSFHIEDQFGHSFDMKAVRSREHGTVDLTMGEESSRSRVYRLDENRTAIVHLAKRWKGSTFVVWFFHKLTTDRDFRHAKQVIEKD